MVQKQLARRLRQVKEKLLRFGNAYVRAEKNGVSLYDQEWDLYAFFPLQDTGLLEKCSSKKELYQLLRSLHLAPTTQLGYSCPARINWLVTEACNLHCVYCIAHDSCALAANTNPDVLATADRIAALRPLTVALSGGEPLLCPHLAELLDRLAGRTSLIVDTNGTIPIGEDLLQALRRSEALVRVSIDSVEENVNRQLRPDAKGKADYLGTICANLKKLSENSISYNVHTVATRANLDSLDSLGGLLAAHGVERWHLYGLIKNGRACSRFDELHVPTALLREKEAELKQKYPQIKITAAANENHQGDTLSLVVDGEGRFFVGRWDCQRQYIGADCRNPAPREIADAIRIPDYIEGYYGTAVRMSKELGFGD